MVKYEIPKTKKIILTAMLLAIGIILDRLISIKTPIMKLSFGFVSIMMAAIWLGPKYSIIVAGLQDFIGAIIFPFGMYFPGWTISYIIAGAVYGIILYNKKDNKNNDFKFILKLIISSTLVLILVNIFIDALWLKITMGKAFFYYVDIRATAKFIMIPIQVIIIFLLQKAVQPFIKKYLYEERIMNIDEYLETFDKFTKDPNLDAMEYLMKEFNNPEKRLKVIHVAGTNGKGSICEMLSNILVKQGYNVGKFISPHLVKFNDGIYFNNTEISDKEVEEILIPLSGKIEEYNKTHKVPVKWFEAITCVALIYFANKKCDLVVLETGLGGLTDCTNIVDSIIAIIANIGLDHIDILGDTLEKITLQKAGIIKENSDTIFMYQDNIVNIIKNKCEEKNSNLHLIQKEDVTNYSYDEMLQTFNYKTYDNIQINLKGKVQIYNAAEALECINILKEKGYEVSDKSIREGLKTVVHKARMEILSNNPEIIFDGGHNENAINNLKENIEQYYKDKKRIYIVSILKTKDYKKVIEILCKDKNAIFFFTSGNNKKKYVPKEKLYKEAEKYFSDSNIYKYKLEDAIKIAIKAYNDYTIFIIGSFYVYKDTIKILGEKND